MSEWKHRLTNINEEKRTAICSNCGLVRIKIRSNKIKSLGGKWRCCIGAGKFRRKKLNISFDDNFHNLRPIQNICNICKNPESHKQRSLALDHDHITGKVRGFLCTNCNLGMGLFKDNIEILNNAIEYLTKWDQY